MKKLVVILIILILGGTDHMLQSETKKPIYEVATFAGGCFWCMQPPYDKLSGVISTTVGYSGGHVTNPSYAQVSSGKTGHLEAVQIIFDPKKTSYEELLTIFWKNIDPTATNQQFADIGTQYQTAIFYGSPKQKQKAEASKISIEKSKKFDKPISVKLLPATTFYPAEEDHQKYYKKNSDHYNRYKEGSGRAAYLRKKWS